MKEKIPLSEWDECKWLSLAVCVLQRQKKEECVTKMEKAIMGTVMGLGPQKSALSHVGEHDAGPRPLGGLTHASGTLGSC